MSIINEALRKTQQSLKDEQEKDTQEKIQPIPIIPPTINEAPVLLKKQSKLISKSDFLLMLKTASFLTITALLIVMAFLQYQRFIQKPVHPKPKMRIVEKPIVAKKTVIASTSTANKPPVVNISPEVSKPPVANTPTTIVSMPPILDRIKVAFEGVFISNESRVALINKQAMQIGDTINGMKIIAISKDTLDLESPQGTIRLKAGATYLL